MLSVYVGLAQDVQRQMKSAAPEVKLQLSTVFEAFLLELSNGSDDVSVLNWVADTFANLAAEFSVDDTVDETARKFYQQADAAFAKVLIQPAITPQTATQAKIRLADVKFHLGDFDAALKLYEEVLKQKTNAMNVQVSAAKLLQAWGAQESNRYEQAINGINGPNQQPLVWGWAKIALAAVEHEEFRDVFYESRFQTAACQLAMATAAAGSDKKSLLAKAEQILKKTTVLYPAMGSWKEKYDVLLQQLQAAQR
jgi:tetratricopeptide (TPR) repeat protein